MCHRDLVPTSSSARGSPAPRRFKRSCPARHRRRRPPLSASESISMAVPATFHVGSSRSAMAQTAIRIPQTLGACTRPESRFNDVGLPGRGGCLSMQDAAGFVRAARPGAGKAHRQEDHKVRSVGLGENGDGTHELACSWYMDQWYDVHVEPALNNCGKMGEFGQRRYFVYGAWPHAGIRRHALR